MYIHTQLLGILRSGKIRIWLAICEDGVLSEADILEDGGEGEADASKDSDRQEAFFACRAAAGAFFGIERLHVVR